MHHMDFTAPTCWLCSPDRTQLCHVHDPAMWTIDSPYETLVTTNGSLELLAKGRSATMMVRLEGLFE